MKIKIDWHCQYSDHDLTWDENRSRVIEINGAECIIETAINQIIREYQKKYQCEGKESHGVYIFADDMDCVIISDFKVERMCD